MLLTNLDTVTIFDSVYHLLRAPDALIFGLEAIYSGNCCRDLLPLDLLLCFQRLDVIGVGLELGNNLPDESASNAETGGSLLVAVLMQVYGIVYFLQLLDRESRELPRLLHVRDDVLLQFLNSDLASSIVTFIVLHVLAPKLFSRMTKRSTCVLLETFNCLFSHFITALLKPLSKFGGKFAVFTQIFRS